MSFPILFVSLLFIGSSVAVPTDIEMVASLGNLHSKFKPYLKQVSSLYGGFSILQNTDEYKAFDKQKKEIEKIQSTMSDNQANMHLSPHLVKEVPTADQVIESWRTEAIKLIDDCIKDVIQYTEDEENKGRDVSATVSNGIKVATRRTMDAINKERHIIREHKYSSCPIYAKLREVFSMYSNSEQLTTFEGTYGQAPGPSS